MMTEKSNHRLIAIAAVDSEWAIGKQGNLLCHLPSDLANFKRQTMGCAMIMGRRTFETFPNGALPGRQNIVITRNRNWSAPDVTVAADLREAIRKANTRDVFVIGGEQIYRQMMPFVSEVRLTRIHATFDDADTYFPALDERIWKQTAFESFPADEKNPYPYDFVTYVRQHNVL